MGFARWRQLGHKLARMDGEEFRVRLKQELGKRQDSALARLGYDFSAAIRPSRSLAPPRFYFNRESVDSILAALCQRIPEYEVSTVRRADRICLHRFDLLGYENLNYGSPIDWHLDAVHGKRAPRKAFYKIRYLDFNQVGDSKVTWELNRHQHLVILAKAARLTGQGRYADQILRQWRHWRADNPYPIGINWTSSLEVAFRSLSWIWAYHLLQDRPGLPAFREEMLCALATHGRHIEKYLSTYFSPNTHLLGEALALFFLGVLCPELEPASRWKSLGWNLLLQEVQRQVRADGFHFEQSVYYHVYALDLLLHATILASLNEVHIPEELEQTLQRMLNALFLLGRNGPPLRFGDDDGGRLFDPRRNRSEHLLDPLATGAILFHRSDFKALAGGLREETIWLLGLQGLHEWDQLPAQDVSCESSTLPDAGLYLLAGGKTQLVADAGPQGTQSGGHGHADALSICLQSAGTPLLIDPGTYQYVGPEDERNLFRGTAMHNTLRIDGLDQAEPASPFSWRRLTQARLERWIQGQSFDLLVASHDGYHRLEPPVTHQRWIVSLKNGIYLIRDVVQGHGQHRVDVSWHLGPDLQFIKQSTYGLAYGGPRLSILAPEGGNWACAVRKESWSPVYGAKSPMTVLNFSTVADLPSELTVLLVTWNEAVQLAGTFASLPDAALRDGVHAYKYTRPDAESLLVFAGGGNRWQAGGLMGDAEFACWTRHLDRAESALILVGGTGVQADDAGLALRFSRIVEWGELVVSGGEPRVFGSDTDALDRAAATPNRVQPAGSK